jgi:hypothetical protein
MARVSTNSISAFDSFAPTAQSPDQISELSQEGMFPGGLGVEQLYDG